jgi:hypothetical protein
MGSKSVSSFYYGCCGSGERALPRYVSPSQCLSAYLRKLGTQSIWPNLNFCVQFSTCQVLQAMMAWAWLGWITITLLLFISLFYALKTRRWYAQIPQAWELSNRSTPDFTIDGDERVAGPKMKERADASAEEEGIDPNNYEFERWKRAAAWLQEENPHFVKNGKDERPGPSTSA